MIISTGGTSMGVGDLLKPCIERELTGTVHFGRVAMKPGSVPFSPSRRVDLKQEVTLMLYASQEADHVRYAACAPDGAGSEPQARLRAPREPSFRARDLLYLVGLFLGVHLRKEQLTLNQCPSRAAQDGGPKGGAVGASARAGSGASSPVPSLAVTDIYETDFERHSPRFEARVPPRVRPPELRRRESLARSGVDGESEEQQDRQFGRFEWAAGASGAKGGGTRELSGGGSRELCDGGGDWVLRLLTICALSTRLSLCWFEHLFLVRERSGERFLLSAESCAGAPRSPFVLLPFPRKRLKAFLELTTTSSTLPTHSTRPKPCQ